MRWIFVLVSAGLALGAPGVRAQTPLQQEQTMTARGTFDVQTVPQEPDGEEAGPFARLYLDKTYHGDLEATSRGQMMACQTATEGSAGYVALEFISGTLGDRTGTFVLQHDGLMQGGESTHWSVLVVPDSGTGELEGITGAMTIVIEKGKHSYELAYSFE
jgi:hypothetical protein